MFKILLTLASMLLLSAYASRCGQLSELDCLSEQDCYFDFNRQGCLELELPQNIRLLTRALQTVGGEEEGEAGAEPDTSGDGGDGDGNNARRLSGITTVGIALVIFFSGVMIF